MTAANTYECSFSVCVHSLVVPDDFPVLVPFDPLLVCGEHWIRLLGLFEEAAFAAPLALHHQVVVFRFHRGRLIQVIVHIALVARVYVHPAECMK